MVLVLNSMRSRADNVLAGWEATVRSSTDLYNSIPKNMKPAFFELVHHPVLASATLQKMWILAGRNNLYGSQARLSTNSLANQVSLRSRISEEV